MDDCTNILTPGDDRTKIMNLSPNSFSNIVCLSGHKNPFDRQFELALKNGITYPNLPSTNSSNSFNSSSPLNTPLIPPDSAFNSATVVSDLPGISDPSPAITTAQITNLILESEIVKEIELNNDNTDDNNVIASIQNDNKNKADLINVDNSNNDINNKIKHRSNMVSVICPPVPTFRDECSKIRSAPVILESANCNELSNLIEKPQELKKILNSNISDNSLSSYTTTVSLPHQVLRPSDQINLSQNKETCSKTSSSVETSINLNYALQQESCSTLKKILPKQNSAIDSSTFGDIAQHLSSLSPPRRKEKTLEDLISKIKATEAALPPKAKPGRKSKSATEEDAKEKKRLSLERNRAAAMRCRLKKKKEIDELKHRVENYEQQNQYLKKIIDSLYNEVAYLKNELMRHKDCN